CHVTGVQTCALPIYIFLQQHYNGLVQFLRQPTVTEQDAEDAAQESLTRLLRYRETEPTRAWKPLLFRIATNVANDHLRQTRTLQSGRASRRERREGP